MHYNLDYALRLCSQNNRMQSCVHIYSQMGLYEEAVNLSLKVRRHTVCALLNMCKDPLTLFIISSIMIWNWPESMLTSPMTTMCCERGCG